MRNIESILDHQLLYPIITIPLFRNWFTSMSMRMVYGKWCYIKTILYISFCFTLYYCNWSIITSSNKIKKPYRIKALSRNNPGRNNTVGVILTGLWTSACFSEDFTNLMKFMRIFKNLIWVCWSSRTGCNYLLIWLGALPPRLRLATK